MKKNKTLHGIERGGCVIPGRMFREVHGRERKLESQFSGLKTKKEGPRKLKEEKIVARRKIKRENS